jgi:hypothetical protein
MSVSVWSAAKPEFCGGYGWFESDAPFVTAKLRDFVFGTGPKTVYEIAAFDTVSQFFCAPFLNSPDLALSFCAFAVKNSSLLNDARDFLKP